MIRFPGMDSLSAVLLAVRWSGVIGNAVAILVVLVILIATLRGMLMSFKDKLRARRAKPMRQHHLSLLILTMDNSSHFESVRLPDSRR